MARSTLSTDARNGILKFLGEQLNGGTVTLYSATMPATPDRPVVGTKLGALRLGSPAIKDPSNGVAVFAPIAELTQAEAGGEATFARFATADGRGVLDVDVGPQGSGAVLQLNTTTISGGGPIRIDAFRLQAP